MLGLNTTTSLETMIDYQDSSFFNELSNLFQSFIDRKIDEDILKKSFDKLIKDRFNIQTEFDLEKNYGQPNAYACPVSIDIHNTLNRSFIKIYGDRYAKYLKDENAPLIKKIVKGEVDSTGMMDYKKAVVTGIFSQIPIKVAVTVELLKIATAQELAAIMLHEIGHVWTFFSFMGVETFRNAVIANTVQELTDSKNNTEIFNIILKKDNIWKLDIDPEKVSQLEREDATNIVAGVMKKKFMDATTYVQYDDNTAEVLADQFATRMGSGQYIVSGLRKIHGASSLINNIGTSVGFIGFCSIFTGNIVSMFATGAALPAVIFLGTIGVVVTLAACYSVADTDTGWTYDNEKDRYIRIRNEVLGKLKKRNVPKDLMTCILHELDLIDKMIRRVPQNWNVPMWLGKLIFSSIRQQDKRKVYQQTVEQLLANNLYVTSAKFKTLNK